MNISARERDSTVPHLYRKCITRERTPHSEDLQFVQPKTSNIPWWENIQLAREWAELLMRPEWGFVWMAHLTFKEAVHPEVADKTFMLWIHKLNREIFGQNYWKHKTTKGVLWARGTERQQRGVLHYHALISRVPANYSVFVWMEEWRKLAGFARIYPFEQNKGGESYVVKYASKGGKIDIGGPLSLLANRLPSL